VKVNHLGAFVFVGVFLAASCGDDSDGNQPAGTGGSPSGGGPGTGGVPSTGGAAAGGGPSGGTSAGGSSTGGTSTGGAPTGGASSGGASSGGASSGGASSGGTSSGGASSGGTSSGGASSSGGSSSGALVLTSPVVQDGAKIPAKFRCTGPSPELSWTGGPTALSYAIVFRDVTPGVSNGFLHWIIYDLPPSTHALPEGVPIGYDVAAPAGAHQGKIWNNTVGFNGPCAPSGSNTYEMTLYALDAATLTELSASSTGAAARTAIEAHDTASTKLTILSSP
jgi:Raf kinase inhibitor-like YbhB/YbcL family protein